MGKLGILAQGLGALASESERTGKAYRGFIDAAERRRKAKKDEERQGVLDARADKMWEEHLADREAELGRRLDLDERQRLQGQFLEEKRARQREIWDQEDEDRATAAAAKKKADDEVEYGKMVERYLAAFPGSTLFGSKKREMTPKQVADEQAAIARAKAAQIKLDRLMDPTTGPKADRIKAAQVELDGYIDLLAVGVDKHTAELKPIEEWGLSEEQMQTLRSLQAKYEAIFTQPETIKVTREDIMTRGKQ